MSEETIIAESPLFKKVLERARRAAASTANVLISGESGTGKEVVARYIHDLSARKGEIFLPINCSAIPDQLLESELFGYAKGAFTGAMTSHAGLFEEAQGGTIFLDEIGDLNPALQAKLLRVLQEKMIKRIGENHYRSLNIRILSATHSDLQEEVFLKKFREDLFFRLNVVPLVIPPLRERTEDILPLTMFFLKKFSRKHNKTEKKLTENSIRFLFSHSWLGNVRELENVIERAVVLGTSEMAEFEEFESQVVRRGGPKDCFQVLYQNMGRLWTLEELSQKYIEYALELNKGAREKTAQDLGIDRKTLYRRLNLNP